MAESVIGTSSYSEAMDFSDIDDSGYDHDAELPVNNASFSANTEQVETNNKQDPPVKIRKKPGRKPNPASPALRKAQNRAAQRAFRERKEKHMRDLESSVRGIKEQRDKLLNENKSLSSENEILKAENWYLKGIVLSLQLVCLQHKLVIPTHCPHVNDQTLSVLAQSIPESIASYLNVNAKNKLPMAHKIANNSPDVPLMNGTNPMPPNLVPGSVIITREGVHTVAEGPQTDLQQQQQQQQHNWYPSTNNGPYPTSYPQDNISMPPLSPMSEQERLESQYDNSPYQPHLETPSPHITRQLQEPVTSNLAAIQTLRLRLRLQSACVGMRTTSFTIQPTILQLSIPHDPRIDLVPTPHMRDRMILYRDQVDLDDCFRILLSGCVFHGGDPAIAGNWELPAEFFEKYWFLTIDYNLRRNTNEWRKKQGLKELPLHNPNEENFASSTSSVSSPPPFQYPIQSPSMQQTMPQQTTQAPVSNNQPELTYSNLPNYFGLHMNLGQTAPQTVIQHPQVHPSMMPVQQTQVYRMISPHLQNARPVQANPLQQVTDESFLGSKNYNMLMTGMYSNTYNEER